LAENKKKRLDLLLVERGLADDVEQARRLIGSGRIQVGGQTCDKAGNPVAVNAQITAKSGKRYVSRGGDKLETGLRGLGVVPLDCVCADIGSSTGGFTDCLLQNGASKVYCVDVGYGLLDWRLRQDKRVVVLERTNARHLTPRHIPEPIDLAVIDASFISLQPLLPPLLPLFRSVVRILALVKPQFQLPRSLVAAGGIVNDAALHQQALDMVRRFGLELGLHCERVFASSVLGAKGNQEFFMLLTRSRETNESGLEPLDQGDRDDVPTAAD
jgi:23S rRNA (cytidine1920-2'-O)/16S rRNA (cytidine1409-2'-O)-methyltransferase